MNEFAAMRLYRGLKEPYRVRSNTGTTARGVDFTDCPYVALQYASTPRGVVLVIDVPDDSTNIRMTEELWLVTGAKRFMIRSDCDGLLTGILPAKDLRARLRQKGMGTLYDADKAMILDWHIRQRLVAGGQATEPRLSAE